MLHPTIFNTAQVCSQLGIGHAVVSPGSRNAPLTISLARHTAIKKWIIPDERAAGFIALGIAQETKTPVVLCCTSGSALLNYAPAIAEAYYREIPLIVLSADRPPELIDHRDGQTIRQFEALKNHVKTSYRLPLISNESNSKEYETTLIEALKESKRLPKGPVHINVPFSEPFYPTAEQDLQFQEVEIGTDQQSESDDYKIDRNQYRKILVLLGQHDPDEDLNEVIQEVSKKVPVIKAPLNNLRIGIEHVDGFISGQESLKPDLLITSGLSVLSKKLKNYLRRFKPSRHLHFDPAGVHVDTYQSHPELIKQALADFLEKQSLQHADSDYLNQWQRISDNYRRALKEYFDAANYSESKAAHIILESLPSLSNLHLSNSMPVRYADLFGVKDDIHCFSNRGTSGIDGCTSTALGSSLVSSKMNVLITGDLAFLYDRNAFFHNHEAPNLRIIVLNNQGGGIFRLIDGPAGLPELEDYFETRHNRTAEYICAENGFEYYSAKDESSLEQHLSSFYENSQTTKVLEVFTNPQINQKVFKDLKKYIDEQINN